MSSCQTDDGAVRAHTEASVPQYQGCSVNKQRINWEEQYVLLTDFALGCKMNWNCKLSQLVNLLNPAEFIVLTANINNSYHFHSMSMFCLGLYVQINSVS